MLFAGVSIDLYSVPPLQTLYTYPDNFRAFKVLIAAEYSEAKIRVVCDPPEFILGKTNKTEEFLSKFPLGKVREMEREKERERQNISYCVGSSF